MRPDDVPVLALLRQSIGFFSARQGVIAENVANANTPGYVAKDLDEAEFHRALLADIQARRSSRTMRMNGATPQQDASNTSGRIDARSYGTVDAPNSETTINGNSVVVEEQMVTASENRMRYETALSLYQKSLGLMRMAIRSPGR